MPQKADIIIKNGTVVTVDNDFRILENTDVVIKDSKIIEITADTSYSSPKVIDAKNQVVIPGLINCHCHAAMTLLRGLEDDMPLDVWLNEHIFPIEKKFGSEEFVEVGTSLALVEMIKSGTTTFLDMYYYEGVVAKVCKKVGMRAFLGEGIIDLPTPNCASAGETQKYVEKLIRQWKGDPLISFIASAHTPYTCSKEVLQNVIKFAEKNNLILDIHLSETQGEVEDFKNKEGKSPVEYLESIGYLGGSTICAHCVWLDEKDIKLLAKNGVTAVHCPESNMKLASGIAPVPEMIAAGVNVALGTDGTASNNDLNMIGEMGTAAKLNKVRTMDPTVMSAEAVLKMATINGARALKAADKIGSIEVGKLADIAILNFNQPHLTPVYDVVSHLVYAANGSEVDTVIINGKIVMENRIMKNIAEQTVIDKARAFSRRIKDEKKK
ncbi:MAG: amidohydrolase [Candidatus Margulisbacteria bacterium]|nr:amidohydrolase [Candidatus Margulisiibacteriota bacterium]MBU1022507.1 amidohydrolase [Candidatus Margulisiibacteriota bacterium]MBU1728491.1 amidohydrolase [Candidatus Margulisiibacteriota bacterium]MBU1954638.1 amidohydrolase [Candidatus Margulisiibacteriota bacterium]